MLLREVVLCWTPNRPPFNKWEAAGTIKVTIPPLPNHDYGHMKTYGAVNSEWRSATDHQRRSKLQRLFSQIVLKDLIPEDDAREALSAIEDVDVYRLIAIAEDDEYDNDN